MTFQVTKDAIILFQQLMSTRLSESMPQLNLAPCHEILWVNGGNFCDFLTLAQDESNHSQTQLYNTRLKCLLYPLKRSLVGSQTFSVGFREEKNSQLVPATVSVDCLAVCRRIPDEFTSHEVKCQGVAHFCKTVPLCWLDALSLTTTTLRTTCQYEVSGMTINSTNNIELKLVFGFMF